MDPFPMAASGQPSQTGESSSSLAPAQGVQSELASSDAPLQKARALLQSGKVEEAERAVRQYVRDHSNSADAHFLLGYVLFKKIQADNSAPLTGSVERSAPSARDAKSRRENAKASLAEYTEGAKYQAPSAFDLKVVALDYVLLKDYADADKWLTKALRKNPSDSEGWYYLGRTKYNENRFEEAISAFQQYLKMDPESIKGEDNLGLAYQGLGRTEDATAAYRTAIAWQEHTLNQDSGPFVNLAAVLLNQNQPQQAVPYLLQAAAISPLEPRVHEQLGKTYERLNQLAKAQLEFERAVELDPQNARLHYVLGKVYQKQGLMGKAKLEFDRSATLRGDLSSTGDRDR
jgi:tetratricopeptide (TPR) repeat protein